MRLSSLLVCLLPAATAWAQAHPEERLVESIVPNLDSNSSCWSAIDLQNLGNRAVSVEVEGHKSSGALTPLTGHSGIQMLLGAGEHAEYRLQPEEGSAGAWVRIREKIPSARLSPVVSVSGVTECLIADQVHSTVRDVAYPVRNPWYSTNAEGPSDGVIAMINTKESPAQVSACYSSGALYSVPGKDGNADLTPVCSERLHEMLPPFGSSRLALARNGNTLVSLTTKGDAIVLQILQPLVTGVKAYKVDSTITFGKEAN